MEKDKKLSQTQELRVTQSEIKRALDKLAKKYLPDKGQDRQLSVQPTGN